MPYYSTPVLTQTRLNKLTATHLDEFPGLSSLLEGAAHLVRGEVEGGVAASDVLLDRLDAGAVALLESLDGLEHHLSW